jgi:hypothetical protein
MLQTVESLIDDARVIIYDRNMFIIQATGLPAAQDLFYFSPIRKQIVLEIRILTGGKL